MKKDFPPVIAIFISLALTAVQLCLAQQSNDIEEIIDEATKSALNETLRAETILETLPDHGFGILKSVRNQTEYPSSLRFEKTLHDALPSNSIVRIKSLATGRYFTARKVEKSFSIQMDTADPADPTTHFVVSRRISPNLQDWIGFAPQSNPKKTLAIDEKGGGIATVTSSNFVNEDNVAQHWELFILGEEGSIDDCAIKNRKTGGLLTFYTGDRTEILQAAEQQVTIDKILPDVYGIAPRYGDIYAHFYRKDAPAQGSDVSAQITKCYENGRFSDRYPATDTRHPLDLLHEKILPDPAHGRFKHFYIGFFDILKSAPLWEQVWTERTKFTIPSLPRPLVPYGQASTLIGSSPIAALPNARFTCLATIDTDNVWGVTIEPSFSWDSSQGVIDDAKRVSCKIASSTLMHWNGSLWQSFMPNVKHVATDSDGGVWIVDLNGIVSALNQTSGSFEPKSGPTDQQMVKVAVHNAADAWAIGKDNAVYHYDGTEWKKNSPPSMAAIINISATESNPISSSGHVCAVDADGTLYRYRDLKWTRFPSPEPLIQAVVTPDTTLWVIGRSFNVYTHDGTSWSKKDQQMAYIAPACLKKKVITKAAKTKFKKITGLITTDTENKPLNNYQDARVAIEIVQAGMGGNLPAGQTININIPISKNPVVTGFAKTVLDNFASSSQLNVAPLRGLGAAWPEQALKTSNRGTVSFLARATDSGDAQIVLGPEISDKFAWKVILGGAHNTLSSITQQIYQKGEALESIVYQITKDQNPLAALPAGRFIPYWVTYDQGFIMAGMGSPGENVFMAQRVAKQEPAINRIGFSSNSQRVEYAEIQYLPPVIMQKPSRIYFQSKKTSAIPQDSSIHWTQFPFRIADNGSVGCEIMGKERIALALGTTNNQKDAHYLITFNDNDVEGSLGISLKKWFPVEQIYKDRTFFKTETYQDVELNPAQWTKIWISYNNGLFILGQGNIGDNHLFVYKDLNEHQSIKTIGITNLGTQDAHLRNPTIASPVYMSLEASTDLYKTSQQGFNFSGNITVIVPFEYQFFQSDQSISVADNILQKTYYPGSTPQQGALYNFMFTLTEDGAPQMTLINEPENPLIKHIQQAATTASTAADLQRAKSQIQTEEGKRLKALQTALGSIDKSRYTAETQTANTIIGAGTDTIRATASSGQLPIAAIGIGIGTAMTTAGIITAKMAEGHLIDAAQKDYTGAQQVALEQKQALISKSKAAFLDFQASNLQGSANFAFRSPSSYVFVDQPVHAVLGSIQIPQEAIANKEKAQKLAEKISTIEITDKKTFRSLLNTLQNIVYSINHFAVVTDVLKQQFCNGITELFQSYETHFKEQPETSVINSIITLLFSAMNNCYLISREDSAIRDTWYTYANKLAQELLRSTNSITLQPCYGEYIWFPVPLPQEDQALITLTISAQDDAFIGLAKDPLRIRNTTIDFYEIVLGGWNNTKAAIRIESLGESAIEFDGKKYPNALLSPYQEKTYQISINKGHITITSDKGESFGWKDPYPIKGIRWLGISSWDSPVTFKSISITAGTTKTATTNKKTTLPKTTDIKKTGPTTTKKSPPVTTGVTSHKPQTIKTPNKKTTPSTTTKKVLPVSSTKKQTSQIDTKTAPSEVAPTTKTSEEV